jgi:uncharacterized protein (TIGR03435 family)
MALRYFLVLQLVGFANLLVAQPLEKFEVASFKPSEFKPGEMAPVQFDSLPGSRIVVRNLSLRFIITIAYGVLRDDLIEGAPAWLTDRYNLDAKGDSQKELTDAEFKPALRSLLEERLHLVTHWETKEIPVFSLIVGPGGPKLTRSSPDSVWAGPKWSSRNKVSFPAITIPLFAKAMSSKPDLESRVLIDNTGLTGNFDIDLEWRPDSLAGVDSDPQLAQLPSIFSVFEKLGLKLVSTKAPQPVLVIDRVEKPSEN